MSNYCIGCRRALAPDQSVCPGCGANQSYLRYHAKSIAFVMVLLSLSAWAGYTLFEQAKISIKQTAALESEAIITAANGEIDNLTLSLASANEEMAEAQAIIKQFQQKQASSNGESDRIISELRKNISNYEAELKKQEGRAGWLSKENSRMKSEINELKTQIEQLNRLKTSNIENLNNSSVNTNDAGSDVENSENDAGLADPEITNPELDPN